MSLHMCPIKGCGKSFQKQSLRRHMRTHTGERPFPCQYCHKRFTTSGHLLVHTRIHTGERPFKCEHCGRAFGDSSNYKRHLQIHNRDVEYVPVTARQKLVSSKSSARVPAGTRKIPQHVSSATMPGFAGIPGVSVVPGLAGVTMYGMLGMLGVPGMPGMPGMPAMHGTSGMPCVPLALPGMVAPSMFGMIMPTGSTSVPLASNFPLVPTALSAAGITPDRKGTPNRPAQHLLPGVVPGQPASFGSPAWVAPAQTTYLETQSGEKVLLRESTVVIGREDSTSEHEQFVRVKEGKSYISRHHARLSYANQEWSLKCLSKNGCKVNGAQLSQKTPLVTLKDRDIISLKGHVFVFHCRASQP